MPKISIITPVFCDTPDKVDWLIETMNSVQEQTLTDWEMIMIDDKSPVNLLEAKSHFAADARFRWFENAVNEGPAKTRNTAVALANSECLIALDSDDLFGSPSSLQIMHDEWSKDTKKIIYGNVRLLTKSDNGHFEPSSEILDFGEYSFELAMNLQGFIPVTAMHSKDCHYDAGGWKSQFGDGLEDVEYWIAGGKMGYCGKRVNTVSFLYRKQEKSRAYQMVYINETLDEMQNAIKELHRDIFKENRFPMSCCGGKGNTSPVGQQILDPMVMSQMNVKQMITTLDGYDEKDLEWVLYAGGMSGSHTVIIRAPSHLPQEYQVHGTGHIFQIHKRHHDKFAERQRLGFRMNQPDPRQSTPQDEAAPVKSKEPYNVVDVPDPELSTILSVDAAANVATTVVGTDIAPEVAAVVSQPGLPIITPSPMETTVNSDILDMPDFAQAARDFEERMAAAAAVENEADGGQVDVSKFSLDDLQVSKRFTKILMADTGERWTVERLAETTIIRLITYPGIGKKSAEKIIEAAKALVG